MSLEQLAQLILRSLQRSRAVEIDGLGVFARSDAGDISFQHSNNLRVFISYATEDRPAAERLFNGLTAHGLAAWLDHRKLLPGQNWPDRIEDAIASSDFFIACFSSQSVRKRGGFQMEIRYALNCANSLPLDEVFLIPVRLDDCHVPDRIQRETHYVDMFPDWDAGFEAILLIITERQNRRAA
jgi:hypothetical protein